MPSIHDLPDKERKALVVRLKRIEGQARGIQRMIEDDCDDRDCLDVLTQIVALRAAVNAVGGELLENFALQCFRHPEEFESLEQAVEQAVYALVRTGR